MKKSLGLLKSAAEQMLGSFGNPHRKLRLSWGTTDIHHDIHLGREERPNVRRRQQLSAFTLVEVLLVLVILVIIGSIAVTAYGPIQRRAYINAARSQIKAFKTPLNAYQLDIGDYPSTAQGLQALRYPPADLPDPTRWNGPYLDSEVPLDPWGNPYQYEYPGRYDPAQPDIWSFGPDGINGTDDDIGSWQQ